MFLVEGVGMGILSGRPIAFWVPFELLKKKIFINPWKMTKKELFYRVGFVQKDG